MRIQFLSFILLLLCPNLKAQDIQKKLNLDDVQIKGETQSKSLSILARQKNSLEGRIPLRKDFRKEILSELSLDANTDLQIKD